ncbi:unnamed protein product [Anisakis simplex]|uniref:SEA domain-containing protein n=1 Tax=Anisakis simplex TaxID=6269 RepID=A0A0M3K279_ANISI|nr:unnamed protein product [Anisakis simplex]
MANKEDSRKSISCDYPITHRRTASSGNDLQQHGIQRQRDDSDGCETISTIGSTPRNDKSPTQLTGFPAIPKFGTELPAVTEWRKTLTRAKFRKDDTASLLSLDRVPGSWKRRRIIVAVVVVAIILVLILIAVGIYLGVAKPRSVHTHRKGISESFRVTHANVRCF